MPEAPMEAAKANNGMQLYKPNQMAGCFLDGFIDGLVSEAA